MAWEITGNHYVTLCLDDEAAVQRVNVLHAGLGGLLEWSCNTGTEDGPGLLRPVVMRAGEPLATGRFTHERVDRWIPQYRADPFPDLSLRVTAFGPGGYDPIVRGAVLLFELENHANIEQTLQVGVEGVWAWSQLHIRTPRPLHAPNRISEGDSRHPGIALEAGPIASGAALGLCVEGSDVHYEIADAGVGRRASVPGEAHTVHNGVPITFRALGTLRLRPGGRARLAVHIGVAPERDGALATAGRMARLGAQQLLRNARLELARLARRSDQVALSELLNRNLTFNYYCGVARGVDDDFIYPLASRSPLHGETAVVSEREALLWTLPALCETDPQLARELLLRIYELFSDRPGFHARYVNGAVLDPGLSVANLCAYGIAVDQYVATTEDATVLDEPTIQDGLRDIDELLFSRLHPEIFLARGEVLPDGAPADQPYVTWDNVLLWAFVRALDRIWALPDPPRLQNAADELAGTIWSRCTVEVEGSNVLACSTDLERDAAIYDDPVGSLRLLPFLEFCEFDDPVWTDTMSLLRSRRYPLWHGERAFPGEASRRDPDHAVLAALCADLLADRSQDAQALIQRLRLPGGIACDAYDVDTGDAARGVHAAAAAGFLGWALTRAMRVRRPMRSAVRRAS
ncbi:MAG TPA: hypothetical protein VFU06_05575 [Longimicrobiales bacterium]|nr:hypothetical protein [Longimicrobiales bacterium]